MANSNTAHSKALRAKTATAHQKRKIESGEARAIRLLLETELANRFDTYCEAHNIKRPEALKKLLDLANSQQ
ncbi:hypothetical protein [Pelistega suis]|uniref:Protein CopB n=1 Tax=Pelistega suis TaxID=1631957 RepID=A0A849P7A1_9BURK|nr:hypothetical protein [Pelistega suis]NOL51645.1 hypothetical protein [Pelistega suis]